MPAEIFPEVYLGDGLYASFDGFQFWLRAPRPDGDHRVALEPATLAAFDAFRRDITTAIAKQQISDGLGKFKFGDDE